LVEGQPMMPGDSRTGRDVESTGSQLVPRSRLATSSKRPLFYMSVNEMGQRELATYAPVCRSFLVRAPGPRSVNPQVHLQAGLQTHGHLDRAGGQSFVQHHQGISGVGARPLRNEMFRWTSLRSPPSKHLNSGTWDASSLVPYFPSIGCISCYSHHVKGGTSAARSEQYFSWTRRVR
jgi:hypothetical protein